MESTEQQNVNSILDQSQEEVKQRGRLVTPLLHRCARSSRMGCLGAAYASICDYACVGARIAPRVQAQEKHLRLGWFYLLYGLGSWLYDVHFFII